MFSSLCTCIWIPHARVFLKESGDQRGHVRTVMDGWTDRLINWIICVRAGRALFSATQRNTVVLWRKQARRRQTFMYAGLHYTHVCYFGGSTALVVTIIKPKKTILGVRLL